MYDLELLLQEADPQRVADAIGLRVQKKGKNFYCECPSHRKVLGKDDVHISNCVLTPHGYCCFSCGAKGDVFRMVMDYLDVPFSKAAETVASVTGGSFKVRGEKQEKKQQPFSAEDLALIGITSIANPEGDAGREIIGVSQFRPESQVFFRRGDEYVIYSSAKRITLNEIFSEDKNLYYKLIEQKAEISLKKYKDIYASFSDRGSETFKSVFGTISTDGKVDSALISEIKNVFLLNIRQVEKILAIAKQKGNMSAKS